MRQVTFGNFSFCENSQGVPWKFLLPYGEHFYPVRGKLYPPFIVTRLDSKNPPFFTPPPPTLPPRDKNRSNEKPNPPKRSCEV